MSYIKILSLDEWSGMIDTDVPRKIYSAYLILKYLPITNELYSFEINFFLYILRHIIFCMI